MFFVEPPPSQYDLHFRVAGVPVRVHPMFWLVTVLMGLGRDGDPVEVLMWVVAVFACILVHELGHVLAFQYYGMSAHVVLHGFGGLAIPSAGRWGGAGRTRETWLADTVISLAGPCAGFLFAGVIFLGLALGGRSPEIAVDPDRLIYMLWQPFPARNVNVLLWYMQFINIFWGIVNLLPVFPLDGGQVCRAVLGRFDPHHGLQQSLMISIVTAAGMAALCLLRFHANFAAIFFGYMAYQNYTLLQQISGGGFGGGRW
ncbi:MAG TPA: site-2 protease family protein [Pirellulales bacterium]|nr:site-2 protease family protein [Pirellulales bacterium]